MDHVFSTVLIDGYAAFAVMPKAAEVDGSLRARNLPLSDVRFWE